MTSQFSTHMVIVMIIDHVIVMVVMVLECLKVHKITLSFKILKWQTQEKVLWVGIINEGRVFRKRLAKEKICKTKPAVFFVP